MLCEDYALAARALHRWKDDPVRTRQYSQVISELDDEILEYIEGRHPQQLGKIAGD